MRRSPAYIETPQIRLPPAVNISHQNIRGVHSEHTQNFIYPTLKCKWPIHTKLLAPNDLISLSYRTQYCVWNDNVYYELKKKIRLKYLSATWPVLEDFLGFLKVSLSRHNKTWNKYYKDPTPEKWKDYTTQRNLLSHTIEKAKENYENKIASEIKHNPKQFWKYVSSKTKSKGKIVDLHNPDGNLVTDDRAKAEILNNHFASVFTKEDKPYMPTLDIKTKHLKILETIDISLKTLTKNLKSLNISKASGPDGINARILRETADQLAPALKIIFEKSLDEGVLQHQWKEAHIVALFKKGAKRDANNYRPVSLTAICGKLLEKIVRDNIVKSLESQGLIHKDQHGFRGGRSCCTQLLEVMEVWTRWFDLGLPWDTIYTDFSKAFDSVPHQRLLNKIHAYGIRGKLLKWIESFLSDRKQRVVLGNQKSNWQPVTSGIPQGSVLGPILFTIFINDIPEVVESLMKLFADDAKIFKAIEWSGQRRPRKRCWRTFWPFIRIPNTYKQNDFKSKLQSRPNQKILFQAQHHKLQTIIQIPILHCHLVSIIQNRQSRNWKSAEKSI